MIDAAISAMMDYLGEDYSTFLNKDETSELISKLSGTFKGIGVSIKNNNEIVEVFANSPALEAGLMAGDIILSVNGKEITNDIKESVSSLINEDSENKIVVLRGEEQLEFVLNTGIINTPLTHAILEEENKKIGYIYINAFTNTVDEEFKRSLEDLESQGMESLIIDVRGNSGGYLKKCEAIINYFLPKGSLIYSLEEANGSTNYYDETDELREYPIVVLINGATASASEILAASLKHSYNATLVGTKTYGKGKVQQTKSLTDGSMVKYTTARWLMPNGECVEGIGLSPDFEINLSYEDVEDTQLNKAIELLK